MDIYQLLDSYRIRAGLTNKQVSQALGHNSESYWRAKIKRHYNFNLDELKQLTKLFNLTDEEILNLFKGK